MDRIRIVLLRTHNGKNLGAIARAMHNFGRERLVLIRARDPGLYTLLPVTHEDPQGALAAIEGRGGDEPGAHWIAMQRVEPGAPHGEQVDAQATAGVRDQLTELEPGREVVGLGGIEVVPDDDRRAAWTEAVGGLVDGARRRGGARLGRGGGHRVERRGQRLGEKPHPASLASAARKLKYAGSAAW